MKRMNARNLLNVAALAGGSISAAVRAESDPMASRIAARAAQALRRIDEGERDGN